MIYIKNYQALNELVEEKQNRPDSFKAQLSASIGRTVTVFVDGGGAAGNGFTGIVIEVLSDSLKLITTVPSAPAVRANCPCRKNRRCRPGACTTIFFDHITAITFSYL